MEAFERGRLADPNARFAAYEALGRISTLKALVRLAEGLDEADETVLLAVVPALDGHLAPGTVRKLRGMLLGDPLRGRALARAVRFAGPRQALCGDAAAWDPLVEALAACADPDARAAADGAEALSCLESGEPIALILADLSMQQMDGIELPRQVRSNLLLQDLSVVMATNESEGSQRDVAQRAGVSAFLTKRVKTEVLREVVLRYL